MSEKRFVQVGDTSIKDTLTGEKYYAPCEDGLLDLLNEQQATIQQLQAKLREKEEDERLYANEILELRETNKEHIKFKSLGGNY